MVEYNKCQTRIHQTFIIQTIVVRLSFKFNLLNCPFTHRAEYCDSCFRDISLQLTTFKIAMIESISILVNAPMYYKIRSIFKILNFLYNLIFYTHLECLFIRVILNIMDTEQTPDVAMCRKDLCL
jgi:hypothetical protein